MRHLAVVCICALAIVTGFAAQNDLSIEALLPADTVIFTKTGPVADLIASVKEVISVADNPSITAQVAEFKTKTGIDPLDEKSLQKIGLDTKRGTGAAFKFNRGMDAEGAIVFLPVSDPDLFSNAFTEILLKMDGKRDLYPAVTSYKNFKISQMGKDIFTAAVNGYFVISSSGDGVHSVINNALEGGALLSSDPVYLNHLKQANNNSKTLCAFIRGDLITSAMDLEEGSDINGFIDSILAGVSVDKNKILFQFGAAFNKKNKITNTLLSFFKTGMGGSALLDLDSPIYSFVSLDLKAADQLLREPAFFEKYRSFLGYIQDTYGIDLKEDLLEYSSGVFNMMTNDILKSEMVIFMPMTDASKSLSLGKKIQAYLKKKYEPENLFGYENVGSFGKAAYYFNETGLRNYVYSDQRGLYIGTSLPLLNEAVKKTSIGKADKSLTERITGDMWGFSRVKKNALAALLAQSRTSGITKKMGDIYGSFKKNDSFVSLDMDISIEK